uniref:clp protease proteolytic subunit n=1 Tax=Melocactus glaucescens TaxID=2775423 RepID=UPI00286ABD56|nr:clp protease proteolytic subunit [Melocactus glaucescens]WKK45439.1 clp protease proteolytic subunit [Melocactus glaucescens]
MPIAPPMVPIRLPGERETMWVDVRDALYYYRALLLCEELDIDIANELMGLIIYLGWDDQDILFFINSPGGELISGIAIHNLMLSVPTEIMTICLGEASSIASYILIAGTFGKRIALPHARIMIHQPTCTGVFPEDERDPSAGELYNELQAMMTLKETITRAYSRRTGKPLSVIAEDMERDFYMSAKEAKDYGIIDRIKEACPKENPVPMNIW